MRGEVMEGRRKEGRGRGGEGGVRDKEGKR